ncbi:MAG TPA: HD domain-containing protein [Ardenticatenaceae bacterium]|nr:HD domain-containing protein [Ardenticatenaceae bacterium]
MAPDFEGAKAYALERLERELGPELCYHSLGHTRDDVLPAAERLAALAGITGEALLLLRTAALYHDIGYVEGRVEHEATGARIVREVLPRFGYSPEQIDAIVGMIMATRLPQSPRTLLEQILADADLDVLGRDDFWARSHVLRAELAVFAPPVTDREWYDGQVSFIQAHCYWTEAARTLRGPGKQANLAAVVRLRAQAAPEEET